MQPCDTLPLEALHAAFSDAFSDYLAGPFALTFDKWLAFNARHGTEMPLSRAVVAGGEPIAFAFVNPRMDVGSWRLAAMGARPAARGTGAAQKLLDDLLARAKAAGANSAELECFAKNERGLRLYRSRGFEVVHALDGYVREADAPAATSSVSASIEEIPFDEACAALDALSVRVGNVPYQVTGRSLAAGATGVKCWRSGDAILCFGAGSQGGLVVQSLVDPDPAQSNAEALMAKLIASHPATKIVVPQLQRSDLGGEALERLGFTKMPLDAVLMRCKLG